MAADKTIDVSLNAHVDREQWPGSVTDDNTDQCQEQEPGSSKTAEMETARDMAGVEENPGAILNESLPIDRGWAWMVLAGAALYLILYGGIKKNFGIIFVAIQDKFGSSASLTSLLTTTQNLVMSFSSLVFMTTGVSNRMSITIAALIVTTSHIVSAFATDIRMLFASIGILEGLSTALGYPSVLAILGTYFDKRRGLANGLAFSGGSFGGLIFAPLFSSLFENRGFTSTLMIIAGITFNMLVTAALLRPLESFTGRKLKRNKTDENIKDKKIKKDCYSKEGERLLSVNDKPFVGNSSGANNRLNAEGNETDGILVQSLLEKDAEGTLQLNADESSFSVNTFHGDSYEQNSHADGMPDSLLLPKSRALSVGSRRTSTSSGSLHEESPALDRRVDSVLRSRVKLYTSADVICGSAINIQNIPTENEEKIKKEGMKSSFRSKLEASFDVTLFKSLFFPVFLLMAAMLAPTNGLLPVFLAPLSKDLGVSAERTGILMAIIGGVGMFSRILCALIADRKFMKLTTLLAVVSILAGITAHCVRFFKTFPFLVFMAVVLGLCCEIYQSMYPVILVEYLTSSKLKRCLGFTLLCHGLSAASTFAVVGALRDATGNYYASYHLLGTMSFIGAILALSLPLLHKRQCTEVKDIVILEIANGSGNQPE